MREPASFEEFWPIYLKAHSAKETRMLHFAGTAAAAGCVLMFAKLGKPRWLLGAMVAGYDPSWAGHAFIERNRPATLSHPIWSLMADAKMLEMAATGALDDELKRLGIAEQTTQLSAE